LSEGGRDRQPTKEERRLMAELEGVLQDLLSKARQISDDPFYDARVLLGMCEAMLTPALHLNEEQEKTVRAALAEIFAERVEGFDPDAALPAEAFRVRQSFLSGLDEAVGGSLDEAQAERWRKISALARRFLEGDRDSVAMPSQPEGGAEAREAGMLKQWQTAFSLAENQSALVQPLVSDFIARADLVLARYGQLDAAPRQLSAAEKAKLQAEVLDLQIEVEKQLLRHLNPRAEGGPPRPRSDHPPVRAGKSNLDQQTARGATVGAGRQGPAPRRSGAYRPVMPSVPAPDGAPLALRASLRLPLRNPSTSSAT